MRRTTRQLNLILVPLMMLMIGFMAVMPAAAATSCRTALEASGTTFTFASHVDGADRHATVDPCDDVPVKPQNDVIVNFAMPLNIGVSAFNPTVVLDTADLGPFASDTGPPPGHIPVIFAPPPKA